MNQQIVHNLTHPGEVDLTPVDYKGVPRSPASISEYATGADAEAGRTCAKSLTMRHPRLSVLSYQKSDAIDTCPALWISFDSVPKFRVEALQHSGFGGRIQW